MDRLSREAFAELPAEEVETLTGVAAPAGDEAAGDYYDRAWDSYKQDVANEDEWGGTEGESIPKEE